MKVVRFREASMPFFKRNREKRGYFHIYRCSKAREGQDSNMYMALIGSGRNNNRGEEQA